MNELLSFLTDHEGHEVWLLIAPGFVTGHLQGIAPVEPTSSFLLNNVTLYLGGKRETLSQVLVRPDQIYAWGVGNPVD
jgi:hypothetical protein